MLESKDVLLLVISFCILWLTIFLSWFIWQAAAILKNVNSLVADVKDKFDLMERAITAMREKFDHMTSMAALLGNGVERIMDHLSDRKKKGE